MGVFISWDHVHPNHDENDHFVYNIFPHNHDIHNMKKETIVIFHMNQIW